MREEIKKVREKLLELVKFCDDLDKPKLGEAVKVMELVFHDPSGKQGLLNVPPQDCRFKVIIWRSWDADKQRHVFHLGTSVFDAENPGSDDAWYDFCEGYITNKSYSVVDGAFWWNGQWMFESKLAAKGHAYEWASKLGVVEHHEIEYFNH